MYGTYEVAVDISDMLDDMSSSQVIRLVEDLLGEGYVPDHWRRSEKPNLSDSAVLLETITELRKLGYTVEPGGK